MTPVEENIRYPCKDGTRLVDQIGQIQRRLATILLNLPARVNNKPKPTPIPRIQLDQVLNNTSHTIVNLVNRVRCTKCYNSFTANDPACKAWLQTTCVPTLAASNSAPRHAPIPLNEQIHIGNQIYHFSHKLVKYRGLIYCSKCGCRFGSNQMRGLSRQCHPPTEAGETLLKNVLENKLPAGLSVWADEDCP